MRTILLLTFLITTICNASAQDSLAIRMNEIENTTTDTSKIAGAHPASTEKGKQDAIYNQQREFLTSVSNEQNDRKKKSLVRIGIGIVFLVVLIAGWRRRRLAK